MQPQLSNYEKMLKREKKTAGYMVEIYCKGHHKRTGELCTDCAEFKEYMFLHLEKYRFQEKKGACGKCLLCYSPNFKEKAMIAMGYAGPKMLLYHPNLALHHLWDARIKPDPEQKFDTLKHRNFTTSGILL